MRVTTILILTFLYLTASGQRLTGKYNAYYGHSLELKTDSTFKYEWHFDMASKRAFGHWRYSDRIIYITFTYDTLSRANKTDSLVLSIDEKSTSISEIDFNRTFLSSNGKIDGLTNRLALRRKKLYLIDNSGQIITKKYRGIWSKRKRSTRYFKVD